MKSHKSDMQAILLLKISYDLRAFSYLGKGVFYGLSEKVS